MQNVKIYLPSYCSFCAEESFFICTALARKIHSLQKLNIENISKLILNVKPATAVFSTCQIILLFIYFCPPSLKGYLEQTVGKGDFMCVYQGSFNMATSIGTQFLKERWIFVNIGGFLKENFWKHQAKLPGSRSLIW